MRVRDTLHPRKALRVEPRDLMKIQRVSERLWNCNTHPVRFLSSITWELKIDREMRDFKDSGYEEHQLDVIS